MAVIDGRIYELGQRLAGQDDGPSPLVLVQVLPSKVVLQARGRRYALAYPEEFGGTVAMKGTGPAAKASSAPKAGRSRSRSSTTSSAPRAKTKPTAPSSPVPRMPNQ